MATIEYTKYRFNKPFILSKWDYETMKELFKTNLSHNINPPSNFLESFKIELIIIGIGIIGFFIAILDIAEWLNWVGGIPAFVAFFSLYSFIPSLFSFLGFLSDKAFYYSKLKRDIKKSNNYNEFLILRNNR